MHIFDWKFSKIYKNITFFEHIFYFFLKISKKIQKNHFFQKIGDFIDFLRKSSPKKSLFFSRKVPLFLHIFDRKIILKNLIFFFSLFSSTFLTFFENINKNRKKLKKSLSKKIEKTLDCDVDRGPRNRDRKSRPRPRDLDRDPTSAFLEFSTFGLVILT